jgi:hypothetical protein
MLYEVRIAERNRDDALVVAQRIEDRAPRLRHADAAGVFADLHLQHQHDTAGLAHVVRDECDRSGRAARLQQAPPRQHAVEHRVRVLLLGVVEHDADVDGIARQRQHVVAVANEGHAALGDATREPQSGPVAVGRSGCQAFPLHFHPLFRRRVPRVRSEARFERCAPVGCEATSARQQPDPRLGLQDAKHGVVEARQRHAAGVHGVDDGTARGERVGRHQQHVGAGEQRAHRDLARRQRALHAAHVECVGDDQPAEAELAAQHAGQDLRAQRRRHVRSLAEPRHREVSRHHRVDSRRDRALERQQLDAPQLGAVAGHRRQREVAVRVDVAVAGEVLAAREQPRGLHALDERAAEPCDELRVLAEAAHVDDRVRGVAVDVEHRREDPVEAERLRLLAGHAAHRFRERRAAGRADEHLVAELRRARQPEPHAALEVAGEQQRHLRVRLQRRDQRRRVGDGAEAQDHAAEPRVADRRAQLVVVRRLARRTVDPRQRPRHEQLPRLLLERELREQLRGGILREQQRAGERDGGGAGEHAATLQRARRRARLDRSPTGLRSSRSAAVVVTHGARYSNANRPNSSP